MIMATTHLLAVLLEAPAACSWCLRAPPRSRRSPPRWSRWNRMTGPKSEVGNGESRNLIHYPLARHWDLNPVTLAKELKIRNLVSLCLGSIAVLKTQYPPLFFINSFCLQIQSWQLAYSLHHCGHMNKAVLLSMRRWSMCVCLQARAMIPFQKLLGQCFRMYVWPSPSRGKKTAAWLGKRCRFRVTTNCWEARNELASLVITFHQVIPDSSTPKKAAPGCAQLCAAL